MGALCKAATLRIGGLALLLALLPSARGFATGRACVARAGAPARRCRALAAGARAADADVDVAVVGAGLGGLAAAAILTQRYGKTVGVFEAHDTVGGVAHAFKAGGFHFDAGPTIVLGCGGAPGPAGAVSPLRQVLDATGVADAIEWLPYDRWGMIVPATEAPECDGRWDLVLGAGAFERGALARFGGPHALAEFAALREATAPLAAGAQIPTLAMRSDGWSLLPLLRHTAPVRALLAHGASVPTGPFAPFLAGERAGGIGAGVRDAWLLAWLDALAFSLSGLPAARTPAAAMAAVLQQLHGKCGAQLDYPTGGFGAIARALAGAVDGSARACAARGGGELALRRTGSFVRCRARVASIDVEGGRARGVTLSSGARVTARDGVICNAPVWALDALLSGGGNGGAPVDETLRSFSQRASRAEMTRSFLHLHVGLDSAGLDLTELRAHYTVMRSGLLSADPCAELNMIAVSCPSVIDSTLAPAGKMVLHAYGAGNEPYELWADERRGSAPYERRKVERAQALWEAVERVIPDARARAEVALVGSPLTHEAFNRRPRGTYGAAAEALLADGRTPCSRLVLCGDGVFPGIGVPAVALSGASAANALVDPLRHWAELDALDRERAAAVAAAAAAAGTAS